MCPKRSCLYCSKTVFSLIPSVMRAYQRLYSATACALIILRNGPLRTFLCAWPKTVCPFPKALHPCISVGVVKESGIVSGKLWNKREDAVTCMLLVASRCTVPTSFILSFSVLSRCLLRCSLFSSNVSQIGREWLSFF